MELFLRSKGFCVLGHPNCPHLLEHCYEVASEELIADWKGQDREERERRRIHTAPQLWKRGPWDSIRQEIYLANRPVFQIVAIGVNAFTQHRMAKVLIPGLRMDLWVDISNIALGLSRNKLRKLARYKVGGVPKDLVPQIEARMAEEVGHYLG